MPSQIETSTKSPTFILVPGHWHTTVHMQPLVTTLKGNNHPAKAVQLHSVGRKSPRPAFTDDVQVIYNAVSAELQGGADVCLVVHSYAGMPGAECINKLIADGALEAREGRGKLVRAVFVASYTLPAGVVNDQKDFVHPGFSIDEDEMSHLADPYLYFFNDLSSTAAQPWIDALDETYYMRQGPVISSDDWRKAPVTSLLSKQDTILPSDLLEPIWQGIDVEWIDAAHTSYVSKPREVAAILMKLVKSN